MKLRMASRGSQLALWQARHIAGLLEEAGHTVEIEIVKTTGDRLQSASFAQVGTKGMFTKEIEEALAEGRADLAVHSLKDLPTELPQGFALAATPKRVDPRDCFVSVKYRAIDELPQGAVVGTSSQRRRAQLKALRPDLELVEFRGNVDTRLRKLAEGQVDAILLAAAGLDRLEKAEWVRARMEPELFCPAAGQGSLGIETRADAADVIEALSFLDDRHTRFAVSFEREVLTALGGGCQVPIGAHCRFIDEKKIELFGVVADPQTGRALRAHQQTTVSLEGDWQNVAAMLGKEIAGQLIAQGACKMLEERG